jgi:hypothetical protein
LDYGIEHREQMRIAVEALYVLLSAVFSADFNNFFTVERFYQLTIYRLSEEIATFAHDYNGLFGDTKVTIKG